LDFKKIKELKVLDTRIMRSNNLEQFPFFLQDIELNYHYGKFEDIELNYHYRKFEDNELITFHGIQISMGSKIIKTRIWSRLLL
jgi:hypothetical protein